MSCASTACASVSCASTACASVSGGFKPGDFAIVMLRNPTEVLYCVPEEEAVVARITSIDAFDRKYAPYAARLCTIENLCGKLNPILFSREVKADLLPVSFHSNSAFGPMRNVHHLDGNVTFSGWGGPVGFKGCTGLRGMNRVCRSLYDDDWEGTVHMGVLSLRLGKSVFTSGGCYMERVILRRFGNLVEIMPRLEQNNLVRVRVFKWSGLLEARPEITPSDSEIKVTGRGAVIIRFSWKNIEWSQQVEEEVLDLGNRIGSMLQKCC